MNDIEQNIKESKIRKVRELILGYMNLFLPARNLIDKLRVSYKISRLRKTVGKKNILCLIPYMVVGGSEKVIENIIRGINNDQYVFHLIARGKENNIWCQKFCRFFQNVLLLDDLSEENDYYVYLYKTVKKLKIDLVMISNAPLGYKFIPRLKTDFKNIQVVDILHSEGSIGTEDKFAYLSHCVDRRVCISQRLKDYMREKYKTIPDAEKYLKNIITIHNGTELTDALTANRGKFKKQYHIAPEAKLITFIGRFSTEKNPFVFVDIAKKLIDKSSAGAFHFVMAGDGKWFRDVDQRIHDSGIEKSFTLTRVLENVDELLVDTYLLLVVSSQEGIPLVIPEALAMRVPVLTTQVGAINEIMVYGKNGLIIPFPNNDLVSDFSRKVLELASDEEKYKVLVQGTASSIVPEYSLKTMGDQYRVLLKELLGA